MRVGMLESQFMSGLNGSLNISLPSLIVIGSRNGELQQGQMTQCAAKSNNETSVIIFCLRLIERLVAQVIARWGGPQQQVVEQKYVHQLLRHSAVVVVIRFSIVVAGCGSRLAVRRDGVGNKSDDSITQHSASRSEDDEFILQVACLAVAESILNVDEFRQSFERTLAFVDMLRDGLHLRQDSKQLSSIRMCGVRVFFEFTQQ